MLNSSKLSQTPKNGLQREKSADSTKLGPEFSPGQITSTPLRKNSVFSTPLKPHVLSHRRYSLSDIATPPRISRRDPIRSNLSINSTGPLLTSANFSVNYGTYEETKSPGLASRIVQYNEETEKKKEKVRPATHQAKYGSPGLFPVVHLFKTDPPVLEPKSRRVTVKSPSPVHMRHSQEYNRQLFEGIIKPNTSPNINRSYSLNNGESNNSTRSVLDALKEISRKRIHASEEYDKDSGKRQKTELVNGADSNKRLLEESPSADNTTSPIKQVPKKLCMYDEYAASCSSTDYFFEKSGGSKRKSVSTSTLPETPEKVTKQVKLINAETQTLTNEIQKSTEDKSESDSKDASETPEETQKSPETVLKIFDDAPLERIRKNRLAALMGSLTGKEPVLVPKPTLSSVLNGEIPTLSNDERTPEKPLVSILTTSKGSAQKTEKHVTFNISENISFGSTSSTDSVVNVIPKESTKTTLETPAPPSSPINLEPSDKSNTFGAPSASVVVPTNSSVESIAQFVKPAKEPEASAEAIVPVTESHSLTPITNIATQPEAAKTQNTTPMFQFPKSSVNPPQFNFGTPKTSPPKVGGFKFDSNIVPVAVTPKPTSAAVTTALNFSFGNSQATSNSPTGFSFSKSVAKTVTTSTTADFSFGKPTSGTTTTVSTPNVLSFGNTTNKLAVNSSSDSSKPSTTTATTMLGFSTSTINSVSTAPITSSSVAPTFKFNSESNMNVPSFASVSTSVTSSSFNHSTFSFGKSSQTPSSSTPTFNFSNAVSTSGGFKLPSSTGFASSFPNTTTNAGTINFPMPAAASNAFGSFGTSVTSSVSTSVTFGSTSTSTNSFPTTMTSSGGLSFGNKSVPIFAAVPITTTTSFGNTENSPFAAPFTTQANFGAPSTTSFSTTGVNSSNIFGGTAVTTAGNAGGFGTQNIFAAPNANSTGFATTTASQTPFGNTNTTVTTAGSSFNAPVFSFGAKTTGTIFPSTTTTSGNIFGGTTQSFTSPSTFGAPSYEQPNSFGNTNFVTTQSGGFGVTNTPTFGVSNQGGFGAPKTPMFGTNTTTSNFGAPQNQTNTAFGASNPTTPAFGSSGTPAAFGGGSGASAFSKPSSFGTPQTNFGVVTTGFNSNRTTTTTQAAVFNFGTASVKPGVFSFGGNPSGDNAKPAFNFNAGSSAPAFGTSGSAFGASGGNASSTFGSGASSGSSFGSTGSSTVSAFGNSGGNTNNTFGNTGGNASNSFGGAGGNAASSFGAAAANSNATFGAPATNTPAFGSAGVNNNSFGANNSPFPGVLPFGTPPPGGAMFNIGSGAPTNSRPRTQLKAKRRT